jgi:methylmalonyl-CoA mutase
LQSMGKRARVLHRNMKQGEMSALPGAEVFPAGSDEAWRDRVARILKGDDFTARLVQEIDGLSVQPLYQRRDGLRAERAVVAPWAVMARCDHPEAAKANAQAIADLKGGVTGLTLVGRGHPSSRGFGIESNDVARVLDGVALHAIQLRAEGDASLARAVARFAASQPIDPQRLDISFGLDDVGAAKEILAIGFDGAAMEADGRFWHEAGATEAEELGAVLASATGFLRNIEARHIGVTLAASQDMFATLAKFRAMRLLWARVLEASGLAPAPLRLHGETSFRMMATLDPHTNILRAVAAVFGAGLGGADSIAVLPFSLTQGLPNSFARRVARNVQAVLLEESNLWRVADPASGAGYVEDLTTQLCEQAWAVFQRADEGDWPKPNPENGRMLPVIGTTAYRLPTEYRAEVEAL